MARDLTPPGQEHAQWVVRASPRSAVTSAVGIVVVYGLIVVVVGPSWVTVVIAAFFAVLTMAAVLRNYTAAGRGWLRRGLVFGAPWVDTDRLTSCKFRIQPGGQVLDLRDDSGRHLTVKLGDLRRIEPMLVAVAGAIAAGERSGRLTLDKTTQHYLQLAAPGVFRGGSSAHER